MIRTWFQETQAKQTTQSKQTTQTIMNRFHPNNVVGYTPEGPLAGVPADVFVCSLPDFQCKRVLNNMISPADGTAYLNYEDCAESCGSINEIQNIRSVQ